MAPPDSEVEEVYIQNMIWDVFTMDVTVEVAVVKTVVGLISVEVRVDEILSSPALKIDWFSAV